MAGVQFNEKFDSIIDEIRKVRDEDMHELKIELLDEMWDLIRSPQAQDEDDKATHLQTLADALNGAIDE